MLPRPQISRDLFPAGFSPRHLRCMIRPIYDVLLHMPCCFVLFVSRLGGPSGNIPPGHVCALGVRCSCYGLHFVFRCSLSLLFHISSPLPGLVTHRQTPTIICRHRASFKRFRHVSTRCFSLKGNGAAAISVSVNFGPDRFRNMKYLCARSKPRTPMYNNSDRYW